MATPDIFDRLFDLPPERLVVYGKVKETLGRDLTEQELEDYVLRGEAAR